MAAHCAAMVGFKDAGAEVFDYGNSLRAEALLGGFERAFDYPGFRARPTSARCSARARGRSAGWRCRAIRPTSPPPTAPCSRSSPTTSRSARWISGRGEADRLPGAARPHLLARLRRARPARPALQRDGRPRRAARPDRDRPRSPRLRLGRLALPRDRGDGDGSDAIADWPLLNALVNTAAGASWVTIHHGGGVGIGRSIHAGMVSRRRRHGARRAEARAGADQRPGDGVIRHADAGYERRAGRARSAGLRLPMRELDG